LPAFRFPAAWLLALSCTACVPQAQPDINAQNLAAFEAFWRPLVPLYGQARFIEDCGIRGPGWFGAVSNGLTDHITIKGKRIWSDEDATAAFVNQSAAFAPVGREIHGEIASADQTPVTACENSVTTPLVKQLDLIAVREGYGR
jgi:hypothetical protein